ncbi:MAG: hypothetical protein HZC37_26145 [Burkholderiales bacterium]|nr:hypothetical protein [Burkholderiales bacterium]
MKHLSHRAAPSTTTATHSRWREPRLPHEHDQSSDAQTPMTEEARKVGEQAANDLERGLVDTDRGPVFERLSAEHFNSVPRLSRRRRR